MKKPASSIHKLNDSKLGEFGEFLYQNFATSMGFSTNKINMGEIDLILNKGNKQYNVDVKTTKKNSSGYKGKIHREDVIYEQIVIKNNYAEIFFCKNSPFFEKKKHTIINLETKFTEFEGSSISNQKKINPYKKVRLEIKNELRLITHKLNFKIRIIFRGAVSHKQWSGTPDNIPGSKNIIQSYDYTVFIQMKYDDQNLEKIDEIFFFDHNEFGRNIKLKTSNSRQQKKGYMKVFDRDDFKKNNSKYLFSNIDEFKVFLENNF